MTARVQAKICGIRSEADLVDALDAGADAVGFISGVTHVSEDELSPEVAEHLTRRARELSTTVTRVLVTHLTDSVEILELADAIGVDRIQVHGLDVDDETLQRVCAGSRGREVVRAVHVTDIKALEAGINTATEAAASGCFAVLLDTRTADRLGGTGLTHDWTISSKIAEAIAGTPAKVMLAGGLDPKNVAEAIATVRPHSVDVNTGVKGSRIGTGSKDRVKCAAFVQTAHSFRYDEPLT
ncbi:phosphoribosylanthranilate isomerase [Nocardia sp. NPDC058658]|uniref:phosphoribosylanthranilate isomerase n=1 Tax=Nocardia sp. NPDC058658 TaxID=3346580 RepID=UPI00365E846D